jgi:hypothetical protein
VRRRLAQLSAPVATAILALTTAAWAAIGDVPPIPTMRSRALAVTAQTTGPLVANDHEGGAVLSADAMAPGQVRTGEVTVSNAGDAAGAFTLSSAGIADRGGPRGGLSSVLELTVLDATGPRPVTLFAGGLRAFDRVALGTFATGQSRRYRFEVAYSAARAAQLDNAYQGASTSITFVWDAAATGPPPAPPPAPQAPPAAPAPSAAPAAPTAPAGSAAPAPAAAPALPAAAVLSVDLGVAPRPLDHGRLVLWMSSSAPARATVTGTVGVSARRLNLRPTTVLLSSRRRTVRLRLPRAAAAAGATRRLAVRLAVTATTADGRRATTRRTLGVTVP